MGDEFANGDGTYNGVKLLAAISGISEAEVRWTADRLKQLIGVERRSKIEARAILKEEAKSKPWLTQEGTPANG